MLRNYLSRLINKQEWIYSAKTLLTASHFSLSSFSQKGAHQREALTDGSLTQERLGIPGFELGE